MKYDEEKSMQNYRPNGINFNIDYTNLYTKLENYYQKLDIVYMIDSTGSMSSWIKGVKEKCVEILNKLNENKMFEMIDIKFGGVFYRDPIDEEGDIHEHQELGSVEDLKIKLETIKAKGGGDTPEDWKGAYDIALDNLTMKWRNDSIKIIFHIADAGAHTLRFSDGDEKHNNPEYEQGLVNLILKCAKNNISIFGYQIGNEPKKSFDECKTIYDSAKSEQCFYEISQFEQLSDEKFEKVAELLKDNIIKGISAFIAKISNKT